MIMSAAATVNFMTQKMIVEFEEGKEPGTVMKDVLKACKKVEPDCDLADQVTGKALLKSLDSFEGAFS